MLTSVTGPTTVLGRARRMRGMSSSATRRGPVLSTPLLQDWSEGIAPSSGRLHILRHGTGRGSQPPWTRFNQDLVRFGCRCLTFAS